MAAVNRKIYRINASGTSELIAETNRINSINAGNIVPDPDTRDVTLTGATIPLASTTDPETIRQAIIDLQARTQIHENDEVLLWSEGEELRAFVNMEYKNGILSLFGKYKDDSSDERFILNEIDLALDSILDYSHLHEFDGTDWTPLLPPGASHPTDITQPGTFLVLGFKVNGASRYSFLDVKDLVVKYTEGPGINITDTEAGIQISIHRSGWNNLILTQLDGIEFNVPEVTSVSALPPGFTGLYITTELV